ncbi:MAG: hypothetical protein CMQ43_01985 [Gammaproteobacteria bacterium]|nr:hypothetical protein [Gammaproteobacteria bacterium]|tara:strand:+ start:897 stop:1640 length:744 start_codon:yes stop_codon:yes gene_type:complete
MNRFGAFLIHLGISLVIFAVLAYLVLYVWYPDFFFASDGGWQGMRIIVFVDLVLGPTLTLIVFNRKKPARELQRDLSIVAAIQLTCLAAGTYVVYESRPIALVYVDGNFYGMTESAYQSLGVPVPDLSDIPGPWPKRVAVAMPEDYDEQSRVRTEALRRELPLRALVDRYVPLTYDRLNVEDEAFTAEELLESMKGPERLQRWLEARAEEPARFAFFEYGSRYGFAVLAMYRDSGEIIGLVTRPQDE